jgi:hypothetical protein
MSALLTTTMSNMKGMIADIKAKHPGTKVIVGGAPLNASSPRRLVPTPTDVTRRTTSTGSTPPYLTPPMFHEYRFTFDEVRPSDETIMHYLQIKRRRAISSLMKL